MSTIPTRLRRLVIQRADNRCEYCGISQIGQCDRPSSQLIRANPQVFEFGSEELRKINPEHYRAPHFPNRHISLIGKEG